MSAPTVSVFHNTEILGSVLCSHISFLASRVHREYFYIGVSGGSLAALLKDLKWGDNWKVFFVDERVVPLDSSESNYNSYKELPLLTGNSVLHAINPTLSAAEAALDYEDRILKSGIPLVDGRPQFDLVLLGMGPDGHTASLFPNNPLLQAEGNIAYLEDSPKLPPKRITMTLALINNALDVIFVVSGNEKSSVVKRVLLDRDASLPSTLIHAKQKTHWFIEANAAKAIAGIIPTEELLFKYKY